MSQDRYREHLRWDSVHWGTHCVDCYPGNCPMRVFVKDGAVVREEPSGTLATVEEGVPDYNPMGCMQGTCWHRSLDGPDRARYPLKRAGERGEGKWDRISWSDALRGIAESIVDAIEEHGPRSIFREGSPETVTVGPTNRFFDVIGGFQTDLNAAIGDFNPGVYITFGKASIESSADDWFHSELILFWQGNPVYTRIPFYHFFSEARYNGAEIVNISPDVNPSHTHADYQIPVKGASDAALALALVQVMLDEGIANWTFIREQTDLGLLVRDDNGRYLRQVDVEGEGSEEQLYQWADRLRLADRGNLRLEGVEIALEGRYEVTLSDGARVNVRPACDLLRERLDRDYTPEAQEPITGVHPDTVRMLARKIAARRTNMILGMNACKLYHGDLIERAMCLVLAVSGNWGKQGTGIRCWAAGLNDGAGLSMAKRSHGALATERAISARESGVENIKKLDPTMTDELAMLELTKGKRGLLGRAQEARTDRAGHAATSTPAFAWYFQGGYRERWNNSAWSDASLPRAFDEYFGEARERGWWDGLDHPRDEDPPHVMIECGGNVLRRARGGKRALLDHLWPKLDTIVTIDFRMTQTAMHSDYFLPAAQHYEKIAFANAGPYVMNLTFSDRAVAPAGESKTEWQIFTELLAEVAAVAERRGLTEYTDPEGRVRRYGELVSAYTMNGYYHDQDTIADEMIRDSALAGTIPADTTLETMRRTGHVRYVDWGMMPGALAQASPFETDRTHAPFRNHVEKGAPFPSYSRRAQFYIDHEWFLEAGEELPVHKPNPDMGGEYPLGLTSGHNRWSVHSMNHMNEVVLGTHRGEPNVMVNADDARARSVEDGELIRIFNDVGEFRARAKVAPNVMQGQIVSYNGWEPLQYESWSGANEIEPGLVKWIGFAGGYGHLNYSFLGWQPVPIDRWVRCDFERDATT